MTYGIPVPNSLSPDKRYSLVETFMTDGLDDHSLGTTSFGVLLLPADKSIIYAVLPIGTVNDTDIPYKKRLALLWSPDSTRLAFHDSSMDRNSKLRYYRLVGERFVPLTVPDLLDALCRNQKLKREQIASSSQVPKAWSPDGALVVDVSAKLKTGANKSTRFSLTLSDGNTVMVEKLAH